MLCDVTSLNQNFKKNIQKFLFWWKITCEGKLASARSEKCSAITHSMIWAT